MRNNKKALELVEKGLSSKTVSKLTESQINVLHLKLLGEATVNVSSKNPNAAQIAKDMTSKGINITMTEKELEEEEEVTVDPNKETETQDAHQVGPSSDDGFGNETDGMGMFEEKKDGPNPWAICHSQVGPKKSRKWERCVREVKKQLKEGKNPVSLFLENEIIRIVEKHMPQKITKGDLMNYIMEAEPAVAPPKPTTKPTTKPSKPSHPGKNPNPGENPAPKARKISPETAKEEIIDVILNMLKK